MISALVGAAGSVLGGLLNRRESRRTASRQGSLDTLWRDEAWDREDRLRGEDDSWTMRSWAREDAENERALGFAERQFGFSRAAYDQDFAANQNQFQALLKQRQNEFNVNRGAQLTAIQDRVADAKAAGVHPLFALGMSAPGGFMGSSPATGGGGGMAGGTYMPHMSGSGGRRGSSSPMPGQSATGSMLGAGIANAATLVAGLGESRARIRAAEASARRDDAEAVFALSAMKRAEQEANAVRVFPLGRETPIREGSLPEAVARSVTSRGRRPDVARVVPRNMTVVGPNGRMTVMDSGLYDELAQIERVAVPLLEQVKAGMNWAFQGPRMSTHPREWYHYWKNYFRRK